MNIRSVIIILIDYLTQRRVSMEDIIKSGLMAFIPQYVDNKGNCTLMFSKEDRPFVLEKNIRTVIRLLCKHYMIDLKESKKRYSHLVSSPNMVPIPLGKKDIFIPLKTRKPMYKNDGAMGYINIRYIEKIKEGKDSTTIQLINGTNIECLCNKTTVHNHLRNGEIVSRLFEDRTMKVAENEIIYDGKNPIVIIYQK